MSRQLVSLTLSAALALITGLFTSAIAESIPVFFVVVNANNPFSAEQAVMRAQIKRLYLKQQHAWPNEDKGIPFDRPADNSAHTAFTREILSMTEVELTSHWLRMKQTSGETPPETVSSVRSLLRQIARNEGAFSVIQDGEARKMPAKVRVLFRFSFDE